MSRQGKSYTTKEDMIVLHQPTAEAARILGRPERSVIRRRSMLRQNATGKAKMAARRKAYAQATYNTGKHHFELVRSEQPSASALAERDRRLSIVPALDNLLTGTPLRGYSELDKRMTPCTAPAPQS
jgi:hypothetical protein